MTAQVIELAQAGAAQTRRLAQVLQATLAQEILRLTPPGVVPAIPAEQDYHLVGEYDEQEIYHKSIAVVIEQYSPTRFSGYQSGSPSQHAVRCTRPVRVRLLWQADAFEPYFDQTLQRKLTQAEHYQLVADLYRGALINAIYGHAQQPGLCDKIDLTSDYALAASLRGTLRAIALTEWDLVGDALIPLPARFTAPWRAL